MPFFKRILKNIRHPFHFKQRRQKTFTNHIETQVSNPNINDLTVNVREAQSIVRTIEHPSDNITKISDPNSDDDEGKKKAVTDNSNLNSIGESFNKCFSFLMSPYNCNYYIDELTCFDISSFLVKVERDDVREDIMNNDYDNLPDTPKGKERVIHQSDDDLMLMWETNEDVVPEDEVPREEYVNYNISDVPIEKKHDNYSILDVPMENDYVNHNLHDVAMEK